MVPRVSLGYYIMLFVARLFTFLFPLSVLIRTGGVYGTNERGGSIGGRLGFWGSPWPSWTPIKSSTIHEFEPRETVAQDRFWRIRLDAIAALPPIGNKTGVFCILEYKRMSDVTDKYLLRVRLKTQYASLRNFLSDAIRRQGWKVEQMSFITGSRFREWTGPKEKPKVL